MIEASVKAGFFDRKAVQNAVDRATAKVLAKFGAFVRQRAKTSIKPPTKGHEKVVVSVPGTPPRDRTKRLKKGIFFRYERTQHNVVIGPVKISGSSRSGKPADSKTVPQLLEEGGTINTQYVLGVEGRPGHLGKRWRRAELLARPYMRPAFQKELPDLPEMWRNSVRAA